MCITIWRYTCCFGELKESDLKELVVSLNISVNLKKRHQLTLYGKLLHGGCPIKGFGGVRVASFCLVFLCCLMCLYVQSSVLWYPLRLPHKNDAWLIFTFSCLYEDSCLITLFVFVFLCWCPTHIVLCFYFVFLRLVYPMLPVSLDCPFLITPSVFSNVHF